MAWPIILIAIFVLIALVIFLFKKKYIKDEKPNYKVLFIIGTTWLPLGVALKNPGFIIGGLILIIIGMKNKDQWRDEKKWSEMSEQEKRVKVAIIVLLGLMVIAGVASYFFGMRAE